MRSNLLPKLSQALSKIDRPGSFCVSGSAPAVLPGLEVQGMGPVALPLTAKQAKELKKHCEQAPYGKGEETLINTSVRRVWRMTPERFALTNPDWQAFLGQTLRTVQEELGLEGQKLESHLYDLLLYEPGSFFLPHRDGEKLDRMVATLVVVLPSSHRGGELVVRHDGEEQTIDFGAGDDHSFRVHYAAFYADCEHEVRPLREGYRLCLVYNLTLAKAKKTIAAPRRSGHVEAVRGLLQQWANDAESRKLVVTLDHQYTQDGLSWEGLKGVDRAKASVLREAARQAGCQAHLALLTFWESGSAVDDGSYYGRRRRWYDEYEEDEGGEHEMDEVFESSLTLDHWSDPEGNRLSLGPLHVEEDEVLDPEAIRGVEPEEDYEGYTGNEGMTLERWYRHAAVVLWPDRKHFDVLCDSDSRNAIPALERLVAQWQKARPKAAAALRAQVHDFAAVIIRRWPASTDTYGVAEKPETAGLVKALRLLDDPGLVAAYLGAVLVKDASADPGKSLPAICQKHGWEAFQRELQTVFVNTTTETLARNIGLLEQFCSFKARKKAGWLALCEILARAFVAALEGIDRARAADDWYRRPPDRAAVLAGLARSLLATEQEELLSRVVAHALATPKQYPLTGAHVVALVSLRPWLAKHLNKPCPALSQWLAACRAQLEALTARVPQPPADWRRTADVSCKCADCAELRRFLKDPHEPVHRFSVREDRRRHLESTIHTHRCDVDCKTERRGSPHTLVCTKNTASYEAALKKYHEDQEHLATLRAIEARLPG
jgi:hypothetical protein